MGAVGDGFGNLDNGWQQQRHEQGIQVGIGLLSGVPQPV
jgi:hypothetical protein